MNHPRRLFLKGSTIVITAITTGLFSLLKPLTVFAARNQTAFSSKTETDAIAAFFPGEQITASDAIEIGVHDVIENGAVVPVEISTKLPAVESITILVEKNPNPLIASFNFSPECSGIIATRIKVAEPSDIIAVVRSNGKLFSTRKFVEVVAGGCG
jgi:sulfur-oxidizing protein SoxY